MLTDVRGDTNKFNFSYKCKISNIEGIKIFLKLYTEKKDDHTLRISKIKSLTCMQKQLYSCELLLLPT